jgi:hypothetical protein
LFGFPQRPVVGMPDSNPADCGLRGFGTSQGWVGKVLRNGGGQPGGIVRENGIAVAIQIDFQGRQTPGFLPEIKPAKQEQRAQPRRNGERLTLNWILEIKHFVFFMRTSSGPVSYG